LLYLIYDRRYYIYTGSAFMSIGGMVDMIEGAEESCVGRVIAAVS